MERNLTSETSFTIVKTHVSLFLIFMNARVLLLYQKLMETETCHAMTSSSEVFSILFILHDRAANTPYTIRVPFAGLDRSVYPCLMLIRKDAKTLILHCLTHGSRIHTTIKSFTTIFSTLIHLLIVVVDKDR